MVRVSVVKKERMRKRRKNTSCFGSWLKSGSISCPSKEFSGRQCDCLMSNTVWKRKQYLAPYILHTSWKQHSFRSHIVHLMDFLDFAFFVVKFSQKLPLRKSNSESWTHYLHRWTKIWKIWTTKSLEHQKSLALMKRLWISFAVQYVKKAFSYRIFFIKKHDLQFS